MERHSKVERLTSRTLLSGGIFQVLSEKIRLPSGLEQDLLLVAHPGAVAVAPVLPDGDLLLVRQYRHAAEDWLIEIPAGRMESTEDPLEAARRELEEETGHRAARWRELARFFPAPGFCSEHMVLFAADDLEAVAECVLQPDADEELELVRLSPLEVLRGGEVRDGKTLLAAALLLTMG